MKKLSFLIVLFMAGHLLSAPLNPGPVLYIPAASPIVLDYESLIQAILQVESNGDTLAYNPDENAVGGLQIRQILLNDYNKRTGESLTLDQMYNFTASKKVFLYYAILHKDPETIAKRWNGSGPATEIYWNKVKRLL